MNSCPNCGAEYPGDARFCTIDGAPLSPLHPEFVVPAGKMPRRKIPLSLAILSYLYFLPAAVCFTGVMFTIVMLLFMVSDSSYPAGLLIVWDIVCVAVGVFFTCLSRGLRRGSRGWRIVTLIFIWWGFITLGWQFLQYLLLQKTPDHETVPVFWFGWALGFLIQTWQYRVLTRPDVRDLFYE